jgi:drug/metabolite transporter (DMT)-like permease
MSEPRRVVVPEDPHARALANRRGVVAMVGSFALFLVNDALVKLAGELLPGGETIFLRGCMSTLLLLGIVLALGQWPRRAMLRDPRVCARAVLDSVVTITYLMALFNMDLANATVINVSAPLMLTAAAALFLGETVGWRRWTAVAVGFVGVLLVIQPATKGFNAWSLLALFATVVAVLRDLLTRRIDPAMPAALLSLAASIAITFAAGGMTIVDGWETPSWRSLGLLLASSLFLSTGYLVSVVAMRHGEVSVVSAFRYSAIPWALILNFLVWDELPNALGWAGMALLVGSGVYILHRERVRRRR